MSWWYGEHWKLTVYAVPRQQKSTVRQLLSSEGFRKLHAWLAVQRPPIWYSGSKRIEIIFDEHAANLSYHQHESR